MTVAVRDKLVSIAILGAILVLAAVLRFDRARADGLTFDEIWHIELSTGRGSAQITLPTNTLIENAPALTSLKAAPPIWNIWSRMERVVHPPLYVTILRIWRGFFGESDLAAKSLSIACSLIAIGFLYDAIRIHTSVGAARWAALIFALAPAQIYIDQQVRGYAMAQMWSCAVLATVVRIEKFDTNRPRLIGLALFASFLALTHYFGILALLAIVGYVIIRFRDMTRSRSLLAIASAGTIFALLWGPFMWRMRGTVSTMADPWLREPSTSTFEHVRLTLGRALAQVVRQIADPTNPMFHWPLIVGALLTIVAIVLLIARRRNDLLIWLFWLGGTLGAVVLLDLIRHTRQLQFPRYASLAAPAIVALIASIRPPKHMLPIVACVFALVSHPTAFTREGEPDWQRLGAEIDAHVKPDEPLIFYSGMQVGWYHEILLLSASHYSHAFPRSILRLTAPPAALPAGDAWIISGPLDRPIEQLVPGAQVTEQHFLPEFALLTRIQISRPAK